MLLLAFLPFESYGPPQPRVSAPDDGRSRGNHQGGGNYMRKALLVGGLLALTIGLLWIGQGTGVVAWPKSSFMINQIQWAGYGAALAAIGLILIWQSQR
jgi:hypothetical protein